jgi:hypothetical protein
VLTLQKRSSNACSNPSRNEELIHPEHGTLTIAPIKGKYFLQLTYDDRGGGGGLSFCAPAACKRELVPA